jgi:hypothetical protein
MTAREAACRYSAIDERAAAGFVTALLHHRLGHDPQLHSSVSSAPPMARRSPRGVLPFVFFAYCRSCSARGPFLNNSGR